MHNERSFFFLFLWIKVMNALERCQSFWRSFSYHGWSSSGRPRRTPWAIAWDWLSMVAILLSLSLRSGRKRRSIIKSPDREWRRPHQISMISHHEQCRLVARPWRVQLWRINGRWWFWFCGRSVGLSCSSFHYLGPIPTSLYDASNRKKATGVLAQSMTHRRGRCWA